MALVGYEWLILVVLVVLFFVLAPKGLPKLARNWTDSLRETQKIVKGELGEAE